MIINNRIAALINYPNAAQGLKDMNWESVKTESKKTQFLDEQESAGFSSQQFILYYYAFIYNPIVIVIMCIPL